MINFEGDSVYITYTSTMKIFKLCSLLHGQEYGNDVALILNASKTVLASGLHMK